MSAILTFVYAQLTSTLFYFRSLVHGIAGLFHVLPLPLPAKFYAVSTHSGVFVTGCNSGLGRDLTLTLLNQGYTVFGTVRSVANGKEMKEIGSKLRGTLIVLLADVRDQKSIEESVGEVQKWTSSSLNRLVRVIHCIFRLTFRLL